MLRDENREYIIGKEDSKCRKFLNKIFCCCCKKKKVGESEKEHPEDHKDSDKDEEILTKSFESILERQLDIKYYLNMCQEFEIIKRN